MNTVLEIILAVVLAGAIGAMLIARLRQQKQLTESQEEMHNANAQLNDSYEQFGDVLEGLVKALESATVEHWRPSIARTSPGNVGFAAYGGTVPTASVPAGSICPACGQAEIARTVRHRSPARVIHYRISPLLDVRLEPSDLPKRWIGRSEPGRWQEELQSMLASGHSTTASEEPVALGVRGSVA